MDANNFDFRGPLLDERGRKVASETLGESFTPRIVEGEKPKTPEQLTLINDIAGFLTSELKELGLDQQVTLEPERVHFLDNDSYKKTWPEATSNAHYNVYDNQIYINFDARNLHDYKVLLHEFLHMISPKKWWVEAHPSADNPDANVYRIKHMKIGYEIVNQSRTDDVSHEHFRGLNELMTERLAKDIFDKNEKYFFRLVKPTSSQIVEYRHTKIHYDDYIRIFDALLSYISGQTGETKSDMWKRYKRGYFTNAMMQFRQIEHFVGKGSLRILASVESESKLKYPENVSKVYQYFTTPDSDSRGKLAKEILTEDEFQMYLKQIQ